MICAEARVYAGAVADGEVELVPAGAAEHVAGCERCAREVDLQRASQAALVSALADEAREDQAAAVRGVTEAASSLRRPGWRLSAGPLAATAVAAAILVAVGIGAVLMSPSSRPAVTTVPDSAMADAVHGFGGAADYTSGDAASVNGWAGAHGASMPAMPVSGATCVGARAATVGGHPAVTYLYRGRWARSRSRRCPAMPPPAGPGWRRE